MAKKPSEGDIIYIMGRVIGVSKLGVRDTVRVTPYLDSEVDKHKSYGESWVMYADTALSIEPPAKET